MARIIRNRISDRPWGQVNKTELGRRIADMYARGDITRRQIREVYAYVPDEAFTEDSEGNPRFLVSRAWGPHHEVTAEGEIILNRSGLAAAAAALGGARARPNLSPSARDEARTHLRRHYRDDLEIDRENWPAALKAALSAGWAAIRQEDDEDPDWFDPDFKSDHIIHDELQFAYGGAITFDEAEQWIQAEKLSDEIFNLWSLFVDLMTNISLRDDIPDKQAAIARLAEQFRDRVSNLDESNLKSLTKDLGIEIDLPSTTKMIKEIHDTIVRPPEPQVSGPFFHVVEEPSVAVKSLGKNRVGGYLVLWGNPHQRDLEGEYFTPETEELDAVFKALGKIVGLYHHALDDTIKTMPTGIIDVMQSDDIGLWVEEQLDLSKKYQEAIRELIRKGILHWSSGTLPGARRVDRDGKILRWPIVEGSKTPTPAEFRGCHVRVLSKAYSECGLDLSGAYKACNLKYPFNCADDDLERKLKLERERLKLLELL